jgi:hypothetical protein
MHHRVLFPVFVSFEDGTSESYDSVEDLECNLEHFDSESSPGCAVVDAKGQRLVLKLELLELKELRVSSL